VIYEPIVSLRLILLQSATALIWKFCDHSPNSMNTPTLVRAHPSSQFHKFLQRGSRAFLHLSHL